MRTEAYESMKSEEDSHWWYAARREILRSVLMSLRLPETARILDAGCGSGGNLKLLTDFGDVAAFELDARALDRAFERDIARVAEGRLPDRIPFAEESFDVIGMFDVLEHLEHPIESLTALRNRLAEGGYVVLTVPAYTWLWGPHDEVHHHFRRYSARTLRQHIEASGFRVNYLGYTNTILLPLAVLQRMRERLWGYSHDALRLGRIVSRIFFTAWALERLIVPKVSLPFGLSLIAVATPNHESEKRGGHVRGHSLLQRG